MSAAYWGMKRQAERYRLTMAQHDTDIKLTNMVVTQELLREGQPGYDEHMPLRKEVLPSVLVFLVVHPKDVKDSPYYYPDDVPAADLPPESVLPDTKHQPMAKVLETAPQELSPRQMRQQAIGKSGYSRSKSKEFV